ncbi:hypothetical protein VZ94_17695 [Methylocucumis oryzae]|uniref:Uncharacterized protein n=1 Tax=Methylocucumis oryzae TaxID=1632867 RepID=A0A0F3IFN3_9GAMM|nr:hypothetical protein VZ94_17695 [Methylocucumis oryzae]
MNIDKNKFSDIMYRDLTRHFFIQKTFGSNNVLLFKRRHTLAVVLNSGWLDHNTLESSFLLSTTRLIALFFNY